MKLFLGIEVPNEIKDFLAKSYSPVQASTKRWEHSHDYHLTLLYIGETDQLEEIKQRMQKIISGPFELTLGPLEFFPRRILYQSINPSLDLVKLKDKVENDFSEWVNPASKPFKPHLTVKRFQRYEFDELTSLIHQHPVTSKTFSVDKLSLFKSEKNVAGLKYHVVHSTIFCK